MFQYNNIVLRHLIHDAFQVSFNNKYIYIDPYNLETNLEKADIIFCTHNHFDHCSVKDIKKILKNNTKIIASINCEKELKKVSVFKKFVRPRDTLEVNGIKVEVVDAYNIGKPYHPKDYEGVGYVLEIKGTRIYHAGDTDLIPEMKNLRNIDIALLPVSGTYVMNVDEAVEAVKIIKPKIAIPMHYGAIVGSTRDAEEFKNKASNYCKVVID